MCYILEIKYYDKIIKIPALLRNQLMLLKCVQIRFHRFMGNPRITDLYTVVRLKIARTYALNLMQRNSNYLPFCWIPESSIMTGSLCIGWGIRTADTAHCNGLMTSSYLLPRVAKLNWQNVVQWLSAIVHPHTVYKHS